MLKAPPISKELIEYLEKLYAPSRCNVSASAEPHFIAALVHQETGIQHVIRHLRAAYEEQQLEDPLHVYEDPEDA